MAVSAACAGSQAQTQNQTQTQYPGTTPGRESNPSVLPLTVPQLRSPYDWTQNQYQPIPLNPSQLVRRKTVVRPETPFEQLVADTVGRPLPVFGQSLFQQPPSTFSPIDLVQVPSDYVVGPGDELQIKIWGQIEASLRTIVDRSGQIYIPQVGQVSVAGVHYGELEQHIKSQVSKSFRNFNLTVNIGRLHSVQVLVVGYARYPGTYTISALSTLVNAVFASGGPLPQGSLRDIQVRRDGTIITHFDFYDLLINGDKTKDVRLQPGDVLYFPHVGPLVAISGSVNSPAIYEMKPGSTLGELVQDAGDLSNLADTSKITIERISDHSSRKTLEFPYDEQSRSTTLDDGDIVNVFSIVPSFQDTVTLRGNVANPGHYPWKPGMRIRDLIPSPEALLTRGYWRDRAAIITNRSTEYPVLTEHARNPCFGRTGTSSSSTGANKNPRVPETTDSMGQYVYPDDTNSKDVCIEETDQTSPDATTQEKAQTDKALSDSIQSGLANPSAARDITNDLRHYAPEINWDYAIIQRVNPTDLSSKLIWINPRKAILEHDETANLELQPGDIVTIFSQRDISVPQSERSRYVIVEGEVKRPGVYKLEVNETLRSVLERAGGLTPNAYIYGSQLTRESARIEQQKSLDELIRNMEVQVRQSALSVAASADAGQLAQLQAAQEGILSHLRGVKASGRVSLPVRPNDAKIADFPNMLLEDSDRVMIPHTPSTVSVVGNVYNPGSFIFDPHVSSGRYLDLAGKGKPQSDLHHAFVLRANGTVVAANNVNGLFAGSKFDHLRLYPGDQIVVPYKIPTGAFQRSLRDWTQITSQLAITAAALAVIHP